MVSSNTAVSPYPVYPLGAAMVSAALSAAGHDVRQFDFLSHGASLDALAGEMEAFAPDLVGVSIRNIDNTNSAHEIRYVDSAVAIVKLAREKTRAPVVLGGPGFSLLPERILKATGADYGVIGEGEAVMTGLADLLSKGKKPERRILGPEMRLSGREIPSALYDPGTMTHYLGHGNMASVQTKRGCPYSCVYCTYPVLEGRRIRSRDPEAVVDDLVRLRDVLGAGFVFFVDSVFNDPEGSYIKVLEAMKRRGVVMPWTGFIRPTGLDAGKIALMKETGLSAVEIGADAASDATLAGMGKTFAYRDVVAANDLFADAGIATAHFYIFGGPGETRDTVLEGIENIRALKNAVVFAYLGIRIIPGTPLAALAAREGVIALGADMLEPVFYFAPGLDRQWVADTLTESFKTIRNAVFPPDSMDDKLTILHKMKHAGPLYDLLLSSRKKREKRGGGIGG